VKSTKYIFFALVLTTIILPQDVEAQCAMCRAVLESDASGDVPIVSRGVNNGILFLMGIPYVLMMGVAVFIFRDKIRDLLTK
jgi:hypothetical protein